MIELGVEPQRKSVIIAEEESAHYLILGDFGGGATEPLLIDRDNLDSVMAKLQVNVEGVPLSELEDFHPDRLFRNLKLFREFDPAQASALSRRLVSFRDSDRVPLAGFRAINGDELALRSA